ncbi:hypothetical protein [Halalkalicoccus salilacus]|uniref:hypothetical protein n=1 Tax=Halalkalicoccus salilacus TaxID=3117459 RepID=UPI00300EB22D
MKADADLEHSECRDNDQRFGVAEFDQSLDRAAILAKDVINKGRIEDHRVAYASSTSPILW